MSMFKLNTKYLKKNVSTAEIRKNSFNNNKKSPYSF